MTTTTNNEIKQNDLIVWQGLKLIVTKVVSEDRICAKDENGFDGYKINPTRTEVQVAANETEWNALAGIEKEELDAEDHAAMKRFAKKLIASE